MAANDPRSLGLSNELFFTTMVLDDSELVEAIEKIKQHAPDYYGDNDNILIVSRYIGPSRAQNIEIIQRVNAVINSEAFSASASVVKIMKLMSIRAELYGKIGKYRHALADANDILKMDGSHVGLVITKTEALIGLHMFEAARDFLKPYATLLPSKTTTVDIPKLYFKCCKYIVQNQFGQYPWKEIAVKCRTHPDKFAGYQDWADYEGPVTIKNTLDGKGRGLFATKNLAAGDLILASKAIRMFVAPSAVNGGVRAKELNNNTENENQDQRQEEGDNLSKLVVRKLREHPNLCRLLYRLYAGPKYKGKNPHEVNLADDEKDFVDEELVQEICKYNSFGGDDMCGIWNLESYINHSCYDCNSGWIMYGDFLIVRAFKDIKEGEEITISYVPLDVYEERLKELTVYGIACPCTLCKFDRKEPKSTQDEKQELLARLDRLATEIVDFRVVFTDQSAIEATQILDRLLELRPIYNMFLFVVLSKICWYFYWKYDYTKAFQYFVTYYNAIKNSAGLVVEAYDICTTIVEILLLDNEQEQAKKWFDILKNAAVLAFGTIEIMGFITLDDWNHALEAKRNAKLLQQLPKSPTGFKQPENGDSSKLNGHANGFHSD